MLHGCTLDTHLHDVPRSVAEDRGQHGQQYNHQLRPCRDVGIHQVVHVDPSLEEKVKVMVTIAVMKTKVGM